MANIKEGETLVPAEDAAWKKDKSAGRYRDSTRTVMPQSDLDVECGPSARKARTQNKDKKKAATEAVSLQQHTT